MALINQQKEELQQIDEKIQEIYQDTDELSNGLTDAQNW